MADNIPEPYYIYTGVQSLCTKRIQICVFRTFGQALDCGGFDYRVNASDLLLDLKVLLKEYYIATFTSDGNALLINFNNGQKFKLNVEVERRSIISPMVTIFIIFLLEYIKNICCFLEVFKLYPNLIIYIQNTASKQVISHVAAKGSASTIWKRARQCVPPRSSMTERTPQSPPQPKTTSTSTQFSRARIGSTSRASPPPCRTARQAVIRSGMAYAERGYGVLKAQILAHSCKNILIARKL